ncbi:hypothetical protein NQZ79_g8650 [Umbelopsis isabellina]|nr:hypothetical protein NQZ79_g8650 [Umbelopsis isabellina]
MFPSRDIEQPVLPPPPCQDCPLTKPRPPDIPLDLPNARPLVAKRKFTSQAIEDVIERVTALMKDKDLATLFRNCYPNTLDTTIAWFHDDKANGYKRPRSFVVTGDIPAMWIRDSTQQLLPYLEFAPLDTDLQNLILGAIKVQATYLAYNPYANAFRMPPDGPKQVQSFSDRDRYELDSLAAFLKLSTEYVRVTKDSVRLVEDKEWLHAVHRVLDLIDEQMRGTWEEPYKGSQSPYEASSMLKGVPLGQGYRFLRNTDRPTETLGQDGLGGVVKRCGLVKSAFRPSDDATTMPFLIPANAMVSVALQDLAILLEQVSSKDPLAVLPNLAERARGLGQTIRQAIFDYGIIQHPKYGPVFAYEVDGYGGQMLMDDANIPSLLSLPLLGFISKRDPLYVNTRNYVLSDDNPWFFRGSRIEGIGGPHVGRDMVWPMSAMVRARTATTADEVLEALQMLKMTTGGTGLMHEAVNKNNASDFTREWFSWANGLFGETILQVLEEWPEVIEMENPTAPSV